MLLHYRDKKLIAAMHLWQANRDRPGLVAKVQRVRAKLRYIFWTLAAACDIHIDAEIDESVSLPHPMGVVIAPGVKIGKGCMIMQQVTLGQTAKPGVPEVCEGAYIGSGARVLGAVRVGRNARVGANAVVMQDVPDDTTVVGIPARPVKRREAADD